MLALDHMIIGCEDAKAKSKESHLFAMEDGTHDQWGTYNYLGYLQNSCYVEWLSPFDLEKAKQADNPLIGDLLKHLNKPSAGNAMQFALRTDNMDKFIEHFHRHSIPYTGPLPGSRIKKDGTMLQWRMLFPTGDAVLHLPFLIEWSGSGNTAPTESINDVTIQKVILGVPDMEKARSQLQLVYDLEDPKENTWQLANARLELTTGNGLSFLME
ncbi:VOC family protein [Virgibacillus senegalensis]|uniref:VOC family protein n=1 Tax=Virgibacillus senegalensis TaxID=1499679 RepID=UPI00069DD61D|nr:VOC family protein [Virgibacillus senegalensis]